MRRTVITVLGLLLLFCACSLAQTPLTNETIIKMVKAGLSQDIVLPMVQSKPGNYMIGPDDLIALKGAGVPDKVIAAIVARASAPAAPNAVPSAAPANAPMSGGDVPGPAGAMRGPASQGDMSQMQSGTPAAADGATPAFTNKAVALPVNAPPVSEIGVYYKKNGEWKDLNPEVVNWKSGGVVKHVSSLGVVKGDMNGMVPMSTSRTKLTTPVEILLYLPEGVAATEYQLLRLHENKDNREFRTVTGGVFHQSGGAARDMIPYDPTKIAPRTYTVTLPLQQGEYGLLPPGAYKDKSAGAQLGKMYTFRIVE